MCFSKEHITLKDSLFRPLSLETVDSSLWSDKCDYWTVDECKDLNPKNYNLVILQWNICSLMLNAKELTLLLNKLEDRNSPVNKDTVKLVNIPKYTLYSNHWHNHKGGGTAILVRQGITHKWRKDLELMIE